MQFTKYLEYLETLAAETGKRSLCEAAADALVKSDVGMKDTLDDYMIRVGTEFRNIVIGMGKDVTEYAVNEAFKQNSDYVFRAFETAVSPSTVAAKLYGDAMTIPPKATYVAPVRYTSSGEDGTIEKTQHPRMVAEGVGNTISDYVKKHALALAIGAALGAGGATGIPKAIDAVGDLKTKAHEAVDEARVYNSTTGRVGQWNFTGARIGGEKGWKYVDYKQKPGIYGPHLNGVPLSEIEKETNPIYMEPLYNQPLQVGWWVSPDGHEVFSTVTGKYFKTEKDFNDPSFTRSDLGDPVGVGGHYILPEDMCYKWDNEAYYGKGALESDARKGKVLQESLTWSDPGIANDIPEAEATECTLRKLDKAGTMFEIRCLVREPLEALSGQLSSIGDGVKVGNIYEDSELPYFELPFTIIPGQGAEALSKLNDMLRGKVSGEKVPGNPIGMSDGIPVYAASKETSDMLRETIG